MSAPMIVTLILGILGTGGGLAAVFLAPRTARKIKSESTSLDVNSFKILQDSALGVVTLLKSECERLEKELDQCRGGKIGI